MPHHNVSDHTVIFVIVIKLTLRDRNHRIFFRLIKNNTRGKEQYRGKGNNKSLITVIKIKIHIMVGKILLLFMEQRVSLELNVNEIFA